jgi:hypothetical protein
MAENLPILTQGGMASFVPCDDTVLQWEHRNFWEQDFAIMKNIPGCGE